MSLPTQVIGPNYKDAPLVMFNLDGTELILSLPPHQSTNDPVLAAADINIFDRQLYKGGPPPDEQYISLVVNSWDYHFSHSAHYMGSIALYITVFNALDNPDKSYNFLDSESFAQWIIDRHTESFAAADNFTIANLTANDLPVTEKDLCIRPRKISDLQKIIKKGMHWYRGHVGYPSMGKPDPFFRIPINQHYALEINIQYGGFDPQDVDSAAEIAEIEEIKEVLLQEFLQHIHITHPPEILAQVK